MTEPQTALLGYDGSDAAAAAIRRAGSLLAPRRALVVRAWEPVAALMLDTGLSAAMREAAAAVDAAERERAEQEAREGAQIASDAGFEAEPRAVRAEPKAWRALLAESEDCDAGVIVVGTRGLGEVKSAVFGSVSSGVLHHSHRPVLVVPPEESSTTSGPLVVGFDGSPGARAAIAAAADLLPGRDALVETAWFRYGGVAGAGAAGMPAAVLVEATEVLDRQVAERAERTAREGAELATAAGLHARAEALEATGNVWGALAQSAREQRAAAIVVGSHGRSAVSAALLGSVSQSLVHHAPVPVLVVPPTEE